MGPWAEGVCIVLAWLRDPGMIGADGIHPNDAGRSYLALQIGPHLKEALTQPPTGQRRAVKVAFFHRD